MNRAHLILALSLAATAFGSLAQAQQGFGTLDPTPPAGTTVA